jgi:hypothetical protein
MIVTLVLKELKYSLRNMFTLVLFVISAILTHAGGVEYVARGGITQGAAQLGIISMAQEWAHRTSLAAVGFPLLAVSVMVWLQSSRDRRCNFASLVYVRPLKTAHLVAMRVGGVVGGLLAPYFGGVFAGVLSTGLVKGLWPDLNLFLQSMFLNLLPGFIAWVVVVSMVTTILPDLKSSIFPLVILWLLLTNIPGTSLFWFYRSIDFPLQPLADFKVWLRVAYAFVVLGIAYILLLGATTRQRVGETWVFARKRQEKRFRVAASPLGGRLRLAIKITLGTKLYVALLGVTGLALFLVSPLGVLKSQPSYVKEYFTLSFSELLFPFLSLLVTYGLLPSQGKQGMADLVCQRPGGEGRLLEQQLVGLGTYLLLTCLLYSWWLHVFVPSIPFAKAFCVLLPSVILICGLFIMAGVVGKNVLSAYVMSLTYWGAAYYLQEKFPWFLSPVYHLSEYSFKLQRDLLWNNKLIILMVGTGLLALSLGKTQGRLVRMNERLSGSAHPR